MNTSDLEASFSIGLLDFVPADQMGLFQVSFSPFPQEVFEESFNLADDRGRGQKNRRLINGDIGQNRFQ